MNPENNILSWREKGPPAQLPWKQVVKICSWLASNFQFTFRKGKKGSHWVLAHELLRVHYSTNNVNLHCNYAGEYSICQKNNYCKKPYLKNILEAYLFIKEITDEENE